MITKAWSKSRQKLLRRMLEWTLLRPYISRLIRRYFEHTETDCLLCAAQYTPVAKHSPMMGNDRRMFCRKCGLPSAMCVDKCSGKRPPTAPKPQPLFMHIPID